MRLGEVVALLKRLLDLWFGLRAQVGPLAYALSGFGLMIVKYGIEAFAIHHYTGRLYSPRDFLNPLLSVRQTYLAQPAPEWLGWALLLMSIPFLWVAIAMSVRRAIDAGLSPWLGLLVFVPGWNLIWMLALCLFPSRPRPVEVIEGGNAEAEHRVRSALFGVGVSVLIGMLMLAISVYGLGDYGAALFMGTPFLVGAVSAYFYNRPAPRALGGSLVVATLAILLCGLALLAIAAEGVLCLAMVFPIAAVMGMLGGLVGYTIAHVAPRRPATVALPVIALPLLMGAESLYRETPLYEVQSAVEIDARPEEVWPHVVGFSELPDPPNWFFRLGIAYPMRATIVGSGVGAVRHCEFSTGAFVEPITVWDEPRRLAFDVASQPPPMHELSPYRHVHPPHLDGYLRCKRGEFRLVELPGGRTRLEGSTWYEYEIYPQDYWTLWSDLLIHRIHRRVLDHIKRLSEQPAAARTG
jgi:uncharacterized membrane protein YhaH (DUF805 family)